MPGDRLGIRPWLWLNVLCLDAPLVAVGWLWLFARAFAVSVPLRMAGALFATAWLIYLADRFADTFSLNATRETTLRHRFCARHRRPWIGLMIILAVCDAWLLMRHVEPRVAKCGAGVGAVALLYLLLNATAPRLWRVLPIKEITIGSVFAAGVVTAMLPQMPPLEGPLLLTLVLFAALCSLNCVSIAYWERTIDEAQRRESIATSWPAGEKYLLPVGLCLGVCALLASRLDVALAVVDSCIALSVLLLGALHALRAHVQRDERTALADLVLLTPMLMLALLL